MTTKKRFKYHYINLVGWPPYVGGDDDETENWQATCECGWQAPKKWESSGMAALDAIDHVNQVFAEASRFPTLIR